MNKLAIYFHSSYGTNVFYAGSWSEMFCMTELLMLRLGVRSGALYDKFWDMLIHDQLDVTAVFRKAIMSEHLIQGMRDFHSYLSEITDDGVCCSHKIDWSDMSADIIQYAIIHQAFDQIPYLLRDFEPGRIIPEQWQCLWKEPAVLQMPDMTIMRALQSAPAYYEEYPLVLS